MTVGIDISALQGAHRMRGIGATVFNFINNVSEMDRKENKFVLFMFEREVQATLDILNLEGMDYEVRYMHSKSEFVVSKKYMLPERLTRVINSSVRQLRELKDRHTGNSLIKDSRGIDVFIQPDQSESLPSGHRNMKRVLIIYDIIPYVLEWEYLWSYGTARMRGFSRKAALRCQVRRVLYIKKLRVNTRHADELLAISDTTKNDFVQHVGVKASKIKVIHLGISSVETADTDVSLDRYKKTAWGYLPEPLKIDESTPFILYVGGGDRRRRIDELVTAFNNLRAQGIELKLVMCGDTMQGPENIATEEIQAALKTSSYLDDIIFTGFTTNSDRDWLYKHSLAFVYPSKYEGFGLPVLEAMAHGAPVICYPNAAVKEVAGDLPIYANNSEGLYDSIKKLMLQPSKDIENIRRKSMAHTTNFTWAKTSKEILLAIKD